MENLDNHDTEKSDTFSKQEQDAKLVVSKTDFGQSTLSLKWKKSAVLI